MLQNTTPNRFELHISDIKTFLSCRRKWDWASPLRRHLEPDYTPIFFTIGRAVHYAIATYYETGEHPSPIFLRFMTTATEQITASVGTLWTKEREELEAATTLGSGMLANYVDYITSFDKPDEVWETIGTETPFGPMPILNPQGRPSSRIFLAGRFDGIVRNKETGRYWLREYKTSARTPNPAWLELDSQSTTYVMAAQRLIGQPIAGVHYRFLMKKLPTQPGILKNGSLSRAINSSLSTTYVLYMKALGEAAVRMTATQYGLTERDVFSMLKAEYSTTEELVTPYIITGQELLLLDAPREGVWPAFLGYFRTLTDDYKDVLDELAGRGFSEYFQEIYVQKTQNELAAQALDIWQIGLEMVRPTTPVYPAPDWLKCNFCQFKAPCKVKNAGGNYEQILQHEYRTRQSEDAVEAAMKIEW